MGSKALKILSGIVFTVFLGYCVYFDKVRHSDPNFKAKLRKRRELQRKKEQDMVQIIRPPTNIEDRQIFFLEQVSLGEQMLSVGDINQSVNHFANAVSVCPQPKQLLCVLCKTLPAEIFCKLHKRVRLMQTFLEKEKSRCVQ